MEGGGISVSDSCTHKHTHTHTHNTQDEEEEVLGLQLSDHDSEDGEGEGEESGDEFEVANQTTISVSLLASSDKVFQVCVATLTCEQYPSMHVESLTSSLPLTAASSRAKEVLCQ